MKRCGSAWGRQEFKRMLATGVYHGTASRHLDYIFKNGLIRPYLTDSEDRALYYAERTVEDGDTPVVLSVDASKLDPGSLRYDAISMVEPVMADRKVRDEAWNRAARQCPAWIKGRFVFVPLWAWWVSWAGVGAVRYPDVIPPEALRQHILSPEM